MNRSTRAGCADRRPRQNAPRAAPINTLRRLERSSSASVTRANLRSGACSLPSGAKRVGNRPCCGSCRSDFNAPFITNWVTQQTYLRYTSWIVADHAEESEDRRAMINVATVQSTITPDIRENGRQIRASMANRAAQAGARLVHFPECALSGYAATEIADWASVDLGRAAKRNCEETAAPRPAARPSGSCSAPTTACRAGPAEHLAAEQPATSSPTPASSPAAMASASAPTPR